LEEAEEVGVGWDVEENNGCADKGWVKSFRKINIRYERLAVTFLVLIHLASITILWRVLK